MLLVAERRPSLRSGDRWWRPGRGSGVRIHVAPPGGR
jgi:hypothetical protein